MTEVLVLLLVAVLCALVFCAGILMGWWYVHHVSPAAWEMVKAATYNGGGSGGEARESTPQD